jgi:hypothetical protein
MDELVFTDPEGPKVTPYQERSGSFYCEVATQVWQTPMHHQTGNAAGTELFMSGGCLATIAGATWRA